MKMTYIAQGSEPVGDAGDQYVGLDRFGRVDDVRWINGSGTDIERVKYGYDRAGNRQWRQNTVAGGGQDEYYSNDGLYQLGGLKRGTLNSGYTGITGTPAWEEDFTYDPTGNWTNYLTKVSGTTDLNQDRVQNEANETTSVSGSSSLVGYDVAGNMTKAPKPDDWSSAYDLTYDAWNRLVKVMDGSTTVATYAYDGLTRRTVNTTAAETRHCYYSSQWQVLEERVGTSTSAERQFVWGLMAVDDLILRDRGSERLYALRDAMHVTAIAASGSVVERYGYDGFGTTNVMDASFSPVSSSGYGWETRFCSYRWDGESNFYQVRNRYLHPGLGRWLSRDPIGEQGGLNLYAYVGNGAVTLYDPFGLENEAGASPTPSGTAGFGSPGAGSFSDSDKADLYGYPSTEAFQNSRASDTTMLDAYREMTVGWMTTILTPLKELLSGKELAEVTADLVKGKLKEVVKKNIEEKVKKRMSEHSSDTSSPSVTPYIPGIDPNAPNPFDDPISLDPNTPPTNPIAPDPLPDPLAPPPSFDPKAPNPFDGPVSLCIRNSK